VTANLAVTIAPLIYAEARRLLESHKDAGHDVFIVSGQEMVGPIGRCSEPPASSPPRCDTRTADTRATWTSTLTAKGRQRESGS
jgi:hypothetical protein